MHVRALTIIAPSRIMNCRLTARMVPSTKAHDHEGALDERRGVICSRTPEQSIGQVVLPEARKVIIARQNSLNIDTPGKGISTVISIISHENLDSLPRNKAAKQPVIVGANRDARLKLATACLASVAAIFWVRLDRTGDPTGLKGD